MEKEFRQVVSDKTITSSKSYNDFLYAWLVVHSDIDENGIRYLEKGSFVYSQVENELGMTRKTLSKYFDYLVETGLVIENGDRWVLADLDTDGFWIESDILERLVETRKKGLVSTYVYLKKGRWLLAQKGKEKVPIILGPLKEYIGIANNTKGNNKVVVALLEELRVLGLLQYELVHGREGNRQFYVISGVGQDYYF